MYLLSPGEELSELDTIYVCSSCSHAQTNLNATDKCPYCRGDDWIFFERVDEDEEEEDDEEEEEFEELDEINYDLPSDLKAQCLIEFLDLSPLAKAAKRLL